MGLDLFFLVMPSVLFVLLQYKDNSHSNEITRIKNELEKVIQPSKADQNNGRLKKQIDVVRNAEPRRISKWFIRVFVGYLLILSSFYFVNALGFDILKYTVPSSSGIFRGVELKAVTLLALFVLLMTVYMALEIYSFNRKETRVEKARRKAEDYISALDEMLGYDKNSRGSAPNKKTRSQKINRAQKEKQQSSRKKLTQT